MDETIIKETIHEFSQVLAENELHFLTRVYSEGLDRYERRILQYGFQNMRSVLDAGCGFGQWALALASQNQHVEAIDYAPVRVLFLKEITKKSNLRSLKISRGSIEKTSFKNESFAGIWCYQSVFLTDWRETLREFRRVLEPDGLLYLNANSHGWYRFIWDTRHNRTSDFDPRLTVAKTYMNTWKYENGYPIESGAPILIAPDQLKTHLQSLGFDVLHIEQEGFVNLSPGMKPDPFLKGEYNGDLAVYELLARRKWQ
jgi:ubiquinone/menaquinone biosynthesis C-methylase UbiE